MKDEETPLAEEGDKEDSSPEEPVETLLEEEGDKEEV